MRPRVQLSGAGKVWRYEGPGGWHFLTLPKTLALEMKKVAGSSRRGWGSVRVEATIGTTTWTTSVFPDAKTGSFLLPIKKEVRNAEGIGEGDRVRFTLTI